MLAVDGGPIVCTSVRQIVKSISEEDGGSSISEEDIGSSISEEDSGSVKCELSDYVSTYTFCHSIGMQMVSLQYEFARVASTLTAADISSHRNHKYASLATYSCYISRTYSGPVAPNSLKMVFRTLDLERRLSVLLGMVRTLCWLQIAVQIRPALPLPRLTLKNKTDKIQFNFCEIILCCMNHLVRVCTFLP